MNHRISVIISTRNRAEALGETLRALSRLSVPKGASAEAIICDNGSADHTQEMLRRFGSRIGGIDLLSAYEPKIGKSRGLNRALTVARGDVLVFTDDDVRPPMDWLQRMSEPILCGDADAVAGGIRLANSLKRPWMEPIHRNWLASTEDKSRNEPHPMIGANMAVARRVFEKVRGFDPEVGPGAIGHAEDTFFWLQVREAGFRILTLLNVEVEHHPSEDRLSRESYSRLARKNGEFAAYVEYHWHGIHRRHPYAALSVAAARLWWGKVRNPGTWMKVSPIPGWELTSLEYFHMRRHLLAERRRPRNYERHGLQKIRGVME